MSAATLWEIAIKRGLGKLVVDRELVALIDDNGFVALPSDVPHVDALSALPPHHRDPFDRMLVAQARAEGLTLVTKDPALALYDVATVWG